MSRVREKLKRYYKQRYKTFCDSNGIAEDYAEGMVKWLEKERLKNGKHADVIEVFKVDTTTLKFVRHPLPVPAGISQEEMLKVAKKGANVGDFVILPEGKIFRRIRGGFREASNEDMSELIGATL